MTTIAFCTVNKTERVREAISGYFVVSARNCLAFTLNYIAMRVSKANREKAIHTKTTTTKTTTQQQQSTPSTTATTTTKTETKRATTTKTETKRATTTKNVTITTTKTTTKTTTIVTTTFIHKLILR